MGRVIVPRIDWSDTRHDLKISPINAFVVAQETRPRAPPHIHTVLNQQARHSWLRNHFKQNAIEQTGNPKHREVNLDIMILFRSPIPSVLVSIAEISAVNLLPLNAARF
jgi:hypothetical protein